MKRITTMLMARLLAAGLGVTALGFTAADAMPGLDHAAVAPIATPAVQPARLVCNYHRCYHVGGYYRHYYYRPYGYYQPYYYRPHLGIGLGGFGVGIY